MVGPLCIMLRHETQYPPIQFGRLSGQSESLLGLQRESLEKSTNTQILICINIRSACLWNVIIWCSKQPLGAATEGEALRLFSYLILMIILWE